MADIPVLNAAERTCSALLASVTVGRARRSSGAIAATVEASAKHWAAVPAACRLQRRLCATVLACAALVVALLELEAPRRAFCPGLRRIPPGCRSGLRSGARRACSESVGLESDLDLDWPEEDDWEGTELLSRPQEVRRDFTPEQLQETFGITEDEAKLWEQGVDVMFETGAFPDQIRQELQQFASEDKLTEFATVGGPNGGAEDKWMDVPVNDTIMFRVAQVPGVAAKFADLMRREEEVNNGTLEEFVSGDSVWPAAVILARWLAIHPAPAPLQGKTVLELGAGCGLPGLLALRLGAARVLLQDRDDEPLRQIIETAVTSGTAARVTTLQSRWRDLPTRLLSASEDVLGLFANPDVILAADVLFNDEAALDMADVLAQLLRNPGQVAYIMDPYKRPHRDTFKQQCRRNGLEYAEKEICTWEPGWDNKFEIDEEWVCRLLILKRM